MHLPLIFAFRHATNEWRPGLPVALVTMLALLTASVALAGSAYTWIERPLERRLRGGLRPSTEVLEERTHHHDPAPTRSAE